MILQILAVFVILLITYWCLAKPKNLPPGPTGIPFLGYLPWIFYYSNDRLKLFENLKKYGNVVCLRIGFNYMVILNDLPSVKEAFMNKGDDFSGRGLKMLQQEITHGKGIVSSEGKYQRENRRFVLRSLRNMGFGKMSFEEPILDSIRTMCESIDKHIADHPNVSLDIRQCLTEAVAANISQIILGVKFDKDQLLFMIKRMEMVSRVPQMFFMVNSFPFLLPFLHFDFFQKIVGIKHFKRIRIPLENKIMKFIQNHKLTFDRNNISDFIYSYLDEQSQHKTTMEEEFWWDDDQIKHACTELIGAGMGTTEATCSWFLFHMANNQDHLKNVIDEIDTVIGRERSPTTRDLPNLPLCEASVLETLRWSSLAATGIPHSVMNDSKLFHYFIPKDTTVLPYLYGIQRDPKIWPDPENFNPVANFLDKDKMEIVNRDKIIPFSVGRRSCIGESLAKMEINLFFITLFQRYTVSLDPDVGMPDVSTGIFRVPTHRKLIFQSRI